MSVIYGLFVVLLFRIANNKLKQEKDVDMNKRKKKG